MAAVELSRARGMQWLDRPGFRAAVMLAAAAAGCAHGRGHPQHIDPGELGSGLVGNAPAFEPLLVVRLMAIRVSDDDGSREARITPEQVANWLTFTNLVFRPAGIRVDFDPGDLQTLRSTLVNRLRGPEQDDWPATKEAADEIAARYPDRLVVFFRYGDSEGATGAGLSWTDYNFVVMPGWPDDRHCGHDHISALAHEIGHHLGLSHTFTRTFRDPVFAGAFLAQRNGDLRVFDGDALHETAPDPSIRTTECTDVEEVELNGVRLRLPRRNIMSYYDERDSLSRQQIRLLRWFLRERRAHHMKLPKNDPPSPALEVEALPHVERQNARCSIQQMDDFGVNNWSAGKHLFCSATVFQMAVTVKLPLTVSGRQRVDLYVTRAPDFGILEVLLDGRPIGAPYDAWAPTVLSSGRISLGEHRLRPGSELTFFIHDKNLAADGFNMGIDAIALVSAEPQS